MPELELSGEQIEGDKLYTQAARDFPRLLAGDNALTVTISSEHRIEQEDVSQNEPNKFKIAFQEKLKDILPQDTTNQEIEQYFNSICAPFHTKALGQDIKTPEHALYNELLPGMQVPKCLTSKQHSLDVSINEGEVVMKFTSHASPGRSSYEIAREVRVSCVEGQYIIDHKYVAADYSEAAVKALVKILNDGSDEGISSSLFSQMPSSQEKRMLLWPLYVQKNPEMARRIQYTQGLAVPMAVMSMAYMNMQNAGANFPMGEDAFFETLIKDCETKKGGFSVELFRSAIENFTEKDVIDIAAKVKDNLTALYVLLCYNKKNIRQVGTLIDTLLGSENFSMKEQFPDPRTFKALVQLLADQSQYVALNTLMELTTRDGTMSLQDSLFVYSELSKACGDNPRYKVYKGRLFEKMVTRATTDKTMSPQESLFAHCKLYKASGMDDRFKTCKTALLKSMMDGNLIAQVGDPRALVHAVKCGVPVEGVLQLRSAKRSVIQMIRSTSPLGELASGKPKSFRPSRSHSDPGPSIDVNRTSLLEKKFTDLLDDKDADYCQQLQEEIETAMAASGVDQGTIHDLGVLQKVVMERQSNSSNFSPGYPSRG